MEALQKQHAEELRKITQELTAYKQQAQERAHDSHQDLINVREELAQARQEGERMYYEQLAPAQVWPSHSSTWQ